MLHFNERLVNFLSVLPNTIFSCGDLLFGVFFACASLPYVFYVFYHLAYVVFKLIVRNYFYTDTLDFTPLTNIFAGLKAGMLCAGILMATFFEMLRPVGEA